MRPVLVCLVFGLGLVAGATPAAVAGEEAPIKLDCSPSREGGPPCVACYAVCSETKHYVGYYVGGGAPCCGEHRCLTDGTWGWDYQGCIVRHKVILEWWHGRKYQGGIGAYRTVGTECKGRSTP